MKKLGIIIVAHQGRNYVEPLLESLAKTIDFTTSVIWVLDNGSTDGTPEIFADLASRLGLPLRLVRETRNLGFMQGNNVAYAALQKETPCEAVFLLNLDTVVHPGWWQPIVAELEHVRVGTVASLLLLPDGTVNSRGNALHFLGFGFVRDYGAKIDDPPLSDAGMFFGSGAAVAFRPGVLEGANARLGTTGIFWEEFSIYAEDADLGWRMRLLGLENRLVPSSHITHDHRFWRDGLEIAGEKLFLLERNRYLLMLANFKAATLVLLAPWIIASEVALALRVWKLYPRRLHLWRAVLTEARQPRFRARRKRLQAGRLVPDREIIRAMTGSVRHGAIAFGGLTPLLDAALRLSHRLICRLVCW